MVKYATDVDVCSVCVLCFWSTTYEFKIHVIYLAEKNKSERQRRERKFMM